VGAPEEAVRAAIGQLMSYRHFIYREHSRRVPVPCPGCAVETAHVHAWCERTVADVPLDGRRVVMNVRVRRLAGRDWQCPPADI
jgi:transposase